MGYYSGLAAVAESNPVYQDLEGNVMGASCTLHHLRDLLSNPNASLPVSEVLKLVNDAINELHGRRQCKKGVRHGNN